MHSRGTPWFLWPFAVLWDMLALILRLTGRLVGVVLGLALMVAGVLLCLTIVGGVVGVPLFIVGLLLVTRGLF